MEQCYPSFEFGGPELAEHNAQIRDVEGRYAAGLAPYWVVHRSLAPGKLPTFRVLIQPAAGHRNGRTLREEVLVRGNWIGTTDPAP